MHASVCVCVCVCVCDVTKMAVVRHEVTREDIKPGLCVEVAPSRLDGRNCPRTRHLECQHCIFSSAASPIPARLKFEDHPLLATSVTWRPTARTNYPPHPLGPRLGRLCNGLPATVFSGHGVRGRPTTATNSHGAQQPPSPVCPAWV